MQVSTMQRMSTALPSKAASSRSAIVAKATRSTGKPKLARPSQDDALWLPNTERPEWWVCMRTFGGAC